MSLPLYVVDAFTRVAFAGNPAAVCPLPHALADATLQAIAAVNNLSKTAYLMRCTDGDVDLQWFTPLREVDLCGHATLASAFVVFAFLEPLRVGVRFHTRSGALDVTRDGELLSMDFPAREPVAFAPLADLRAALGAPALEWLNGQYPLAVLADEAAVRAARPDVARIDSLSITAPGDDCDFVSRFFAPGYGIAEDPVTGSAHCSLIPYWSKRLGKRALYARQVSVRGGELWCEARGARVGLRGACVLYSRGEIALDV